MQTQTDEKIQYTKEEYLILEDQSKLRHEFRKGEVVAMAGGTAVHNQIAVNTTTGLNILLRKKPCIVFGSDLKVELAHSYVYPDAFVICGDVVFASNRKDIVSNPCLLVEVLSDSTEQYDRGEKFEQYRSLPSFREYVLVSQNKPSVEVFFKQDDKHWLMTVITDLDDTAVLQSLEISIPMRDIYDKVFD